MKNMNQFARCRTIRLGAFVLVAGLLSGSLFAGQTKAVAPTEEDPAFSNWINFTLGGLINNGNQGQFQQQHPVSGPVFGGIEDMHLEKSLGNKAQITLDGHAIFANSDYNLKMEISMPDVGYVKGGFTEFCTYSNGNGGYMPPTDTLPGGQFFSGPEYAMYRGLAWIELGLRVPTLPELTLRYEHGFRSGQEDSTSWGSSDNVGLHGTSIGAAPGYAVSTSGTAANSNTRKIVPAFRNINEKRDTFLFDAKYLIGKPEAFGNTELKLGMRMDFISNSDSLNTQNLPGAAPTALATSTSGRINLNQLNIPLVPNNYFLTDTQNQSSNIYNGHISSVTRFGDKLMLTLGYSYTSVASHVEGDRIVGPQNGVPYSPYSNNLAYGNAISSAYVDMGGASQMGQSVSAINLLWNPIESLTITPSLRIENDNTVSQSNYLTLVAQSTPVAARATKTSYYNIWWMQLPARQQVARTLVNTSVQLNNIAEALEIRYTGIENWVFYTQGEWIQANEARTTGQPMSSYRGSTDYNFNGINTSMNQKYTLGSNWYPLPQLNFAFQYYLQMQNIKQTIFSDDNPAVTTTYFPYASGTTKAYTTTVGARSYPSNQRLYSQFWTTNDVNFRVTWRPLSNLTLVSRYDFTRTLIDSQWQQDAGTAVAGPTTTVYQNGQSGLMTNNVISESITWNPLDRLYLQGSASYVVNSSDSPAATLTPSVLNSNNNYWTASLGLGFAIDNKTQFRADCSYYCANNYVNNSQYGVPYGAGATEYDFTASITRQISRNVGVSLKYFLNSYRDVLSGGNNSYTAQVITSSLQVQF